MGAEENRAVIQRLFAEFYGQGRHDLAEQFFAPALVMHDAAAGDVAIGPEQVRQGQQAQQASTPDLAMTLLQLVAEGDLVAYHWSVAGTQVTGGRFNTQGMTIVRFGPDGRIAEMWRVFDQFSMVNQLQQAQLGQIAGMQAVAQAAADGETILKQGKLGKKGRWSWKVSTGGSGDDMSSDDFDSD